MTDERPESQRADPRYTNIPIPRMHCKHLTSLGSQFSSEGWTCAAYPDGILYGILTRQYPHTEISDLQTGDIVAYDPVIYEESDTGRKWHYTADGGWVYVDEARYTECRDLQTAWRGVNGHRSKVLTPCQNWTSHGHRVLVISVK